VNNIEYVRVLRPLLPAEAFRPNPWAYVPISIHLAIMLAGWIASQYVPGIWWPVLGLMVGNSMSVLHLYAHEVSHRSVTTNKYLLYPTAVLLWGLMFMPATLWQRIHGAHHAHTNGDDDTDRRFLADELTPVGLIAAAMMFPNRTLRYSLTCFFYGIVFPWRHTIAMLYAGKSKPDFVTAKPRYAPADKLRIGFEFLFIAALQFAILKLTHSACFWVGILPLFITSAVNAAYVMTNHGLKPVDDGHDVLAASGAEIRGHIALELLVSHRASSFSDHEFQVLSTRGRAAQRALPRPLSLHPVFRGLVRVVAHYHRERAPRRGGATGRGAACDSDSSSAICLAGRYATPIRLT
jgi:fatty acid desaturase